MRVVGLPAVTLSVHYDLPVIANPTLMNNRRLHNRHCCAHSFGENLPEPNDRRFTLFANNLANGAAGLDTIS
jgi:hypothetical protein